MNALYELKEKAKKAGQYGTRVCRAADEVVGIANYLEANDGIEIIVDNEMIEAIKEDMNEIRSCCFRLYKALSEPDNIDANEAVPGLEDGTNEFPLCQFFQVKAAMQGENLVVRLPLLWSRQTVVMHSRGKQIRADYLPWMVTELQAELAGLAGKLPRFRRRHFSYLHVISEDTAQFADADNYETKAITDVVSSAIFGDDGGMEATFSSYSERAKTLKAGSYLVVSPRFGEPPSMAELHEILADSDAEKPLLF